MLKDKNKIKKDSAKLLDSKRSHFEQSNETKFNENLDNTVLLNSWSLILYISFETALYTTLILSLLILKTCSIEFFEKSLTVSTNFDLLATLGNIIL